MRAVHSLTNLVFSWLDVLRVHIHIGVLLLKYPSLTIQRPGVWRYDALSAIEIGKNVSFGPFAEVVVFSRTPKSHVCGRLLCGDRVFIGAGSNIRAAGGVISIGSNTLIAQNVALVAANHSVSLGEIFRDLNWDEEKTGVTIGQNCWIGAASVVLPGVRIGDNCVIGAGSVVTRDVPDNEIWLGVPARFHAKITQPK